MHTEPGEVSKNETISVAITAEIYPINSAFTLQLSVIILYMNVVFAISNLILLNFWQEW